MPLSAESINYTESSAQADILVPLHAESVTITYSSATLNVRTYKNDPKKYAKSEPIFIYDRDERLQLILSDDTIPYREGWFVEQLNGEVTLEFEVIADHIDVDKIMEDGRAVVRNVDGEYAEFIIRIIDDSDGDGTFKKVEAEGGEYELIDHIVTQYKASNVTLRTALGAVIQGSRWQVGQVDDLGTASVDLKYTTGKNAIYELLQIFGGEVRYRVEVDGNRIIRRYIDVFKKRGIYTGKRFEAGKDIISTNRTIDTSGIKTRLYGYGRSGEDNKPRLTFADVVWKKENGDPVDKPLGQIWVGDPDALNKWGYDQGTLHRTGFYDGQEEDPAELLLNTWNHLQTVNDAVETYDFDVLLLEELTEYAHEKVRLGDVIFAINRNIHPSVEVEASIIEYRQNLNNRSESEVTLGSFRNAYDTSSRFERTEKTVNDRQGNWDEKVDQEELEEVESYVQERINDAIERLEQAELELDEALDELSDAQAILDTVTENVGGVTRLKGTLATDRIIAENAVVTGTLNTNNAIFQKGTFREINVLDAYIQDAVITGDLIGGSIDINTDARIGQHLYLGCNFPYTHERAIYFDPNNNVSIYYTGTGMDLNLGAPETYVDGSLHVGDIEFHKSDQPEVSSWYTETGFCGIGGYASPSSNVVFYAVPFRFKRSITPSTIYFSDGTGNRTPRVAQYSRDGFLFALDFGSGGTAGLLQWRGNYQVGSAG